MMAATLLAIILWYHSLRLAQIQAVLNNLEHAKHYHPEQAWKFQDGKP